MPKLLLDMDNKWMISSPFTIKDPYWLIWKNLADYCINVKLLVAIEFWFCPYLFRCPAVITNCDEAADCAAALTTGIFCGLCQSDGEDICAEEDTDTFAETLAEVFEAIEEAAPVVAAAGGSVAVAAMFAMPSLPITLASGVPPGIFSFQLLQTVLYLNISFKHWNLFMIG